MEKILNSPEGQLSSISDYYQAYMMNKRAKHYGVTSTSKFIPILADKYNKEWLTEFDTDKFTIGAFPSIDGISIETLQFVEMLANIVNSKKSNDNGKKFLQQAL